MNPSIHGHEVLEVVLAASGPITPESLEAQVSQRFGSDARFHTCSANGLTVRQLIDLLESKGKLVLADGGLQADRSRICEH